MRVSKWGNSLAVRLPKALVDALELKEGDQVQLDIRDSQKFAISKKPDRDALLERLNANRGRIPADFTFDRDEANAR